MNWLSKIGLSPTKWFSRKLFVFLIACAGLYFDKLDTNAWLIVAGTYIGAQMFVDLFKIHKGQ